MTPDPRTHYANDHDPDAYWACEHPERPADYGTRWAWECDACWIHMITSHRMGVGPTVDYHDETSCVPHELERATEHRRNQGLWVP